MKLTWNAELEIWVVFITYKIMHETTSFDIMYIFKTLWNICVTNDHGYVPLVVNTSKSFPRSWRVWLVKQELRTLPKHLSSPSVFSGVRVTRSLVVCVCFVDRCLSFCTFSFGHCDVCSSSIYGFWLPLWYLQTLLNAKCQLESLWLMRGFIFRNRVLWYIINGSNMFLLNVPTTDV